MIRRRNRDLRIFAFPALLVFLMAGSCSARSSPWTVRGNVRNQTKHVPVSGEEVVLIRLANGMQQEAHTRTDAQGNFTLPIEISGALHLVRVIYQSVAYYQRVSDGAAITVDVFDARPHVAGVSGESEILRIASNGNSLHVSDMYELENASSPPRTQVSSQSFEFYLPSEAKLDSVLAAAPGGMAVLTSAHALGAEAGKWAVDFPLRPGATKFAVNYDLPYEGHALFTPRITYPSRQLAIMIPSTMKFSSTSADFHRLEGGNAEFQVQALNNPKPGEVPSFEVSGIGTLPPIGEKPSSKTETVQRSSSHRSATFISPSAALFSGVNLLKISRLLVLVIALGCVIWTACKRKSIVKSESSESLISPNPGTSVMETLKQELLELEVNRLKGSISADDYDCIKQRLEETIMHTTAKAG